MISFNPAPLKAGLDRQLRHLEAALTDGLKQSATAVLESAKERTPGKEVAAGWTIVPGGENPKQSREPAPEPAELKLGGGALVVNRHPAARVMEDGTFPEGPHVTGGRAKAAPEGLAAAFHYHDQATVNDAYQLTFDEAAHNG